MNGIPLLKPNNIFKFSADSFSSETLQANFPLGRGIARPYFAIRVNSQACHIQVGVQSASDNHWFSLRTLGISDQDVWLSFQCMGWKTWRSDGKLTEGKVCYAVRNLKLNHKIMVNYSVVGFYLDEANHQFRFYINDEPIEVEMDDVDYPLHDGWHQRTSTYTHPVISLHDWYPFAQVMQKNTLIELINDWIPPPLKKQTTFLI